VGIGIGAVDLGLPQSKLDLGDVCTAVRSDGAAPGMGHTFLRSCQDTISAQMTNRSNAMMMTAHSG
jgi:hypothetical protein